MVEGVREVFGCPSTAVDWRERDSETGFDWDIIESLLRQAKATGKCSEYIETWMVEESELRQLDYLRLSSVWDALLRLVAVTHQGLTITNCNHVNQLTGPITDSSG